MAEVEIELGIKGAHPEVVKAFESNMDITTGEGTYSTTGYSESADELMRQLSAAQHLYGDFAYLVRKHWPDDDGSSTAVYYVPGMGECEVSTDAGGAPIVESDTLLDMIRKARSLDALREEVLEYTGRRYIDAFDSYEHVPLKLAGSDVRFEYAFDIEPVKVGWKPDEPEYEVDRITVTIAWWDQDEEGPSGYHVDVTARGWKLTAKGKRDRRETLRHPIGSLRHQLIPQGKQAVKQALEQANLGDAHVLNPTGDIEATWTLEYVRS